MGARMLLAHGRAGRLPALPTSPKPWATQLERGLYWWASVSSQPAAQTPLPQVWLFALLLFSLKYVDEECLVSS